MITGAVLWFINRAMDKADIVGNIGCLVVVTGCIDAVIVLGSIYLFLSLR